MKVMYRCPKCKSLDVETLGIITIPPERMRCENCGFEGNDFVFEAGDVSSPVDDALDLARPKRKTSAKKRSK